MDQSPDPSKPTQGTSPEALHERPPGIALTLAEAADACGVGRGTIYRWLDRGAFPNAYREQPGGIWRIPVVDLEAAGLRPRRHLYRRVAIARIAIGVLFAVDAYLKWIPSFSRGTFLDEISGAAEDQPKWLHPWFNFWTKVASSNPRLLAYVIAVVETLIALALILGVARAVTYFAAALFTLAIWAIPEGFGGPYTHGATDIGTGIIYTVVFLALYQLDTLADESPLSLDPLIERRFPRWRVVSEPWFRVRGGGTGAVARVDGKSS